MDENKKLSSEEQRRLMKEQFKQDLRARKEFLQKVEELKRQQPILKALEEMNVEDDSDEWIAKLNQETAFREAKTEIALDSAGLNNPPAEDVPPLSEEEMQKIAAAELVKKMKAEMQGQTSNPAPETPPSAEDTPKDDEERPSRKMLDGLL